MKEIYRNNKPFLLSFGIVMLAVTPVLLFTGKRELHLCLNYYHAPFFDFFFRYITYLGDGITVTLVAALFLFRSLRFAMFIGFSNIGVSAVVQFLKRIVFSEAVRPATLFAGNEQLHWVENVQLHHYNSFPSGHTAAAFALFFSLSIVVKPAVLKGIFFLLALLAAYSRIYLSQHFLIDTFFGAIIGVLLVFAFYFVIMRSHIHWFDKSITTIFRKNEK